MIPEIVGPILSPCDIFDTDDFLSFRMGNRLWCDVSDKEFVRGMSIRPTVTRVHEGLGIPGNGIEQETPRIVTPILDRSPQLYCRVERVSMTTLSQITERDCYSEHDLEARVQMARHKLLSCSRLRSAAFSGLNTIQQLAGTPFSIPTVETMTFGETSGGSLDLTAQCFPNVTKLDINLWCPEDWQSADDAWLQLEAR